MRNCLVFRSIAICLACLCMLGGIAAALSGCGKSEPERPQVTDSSEAPSAPETEKAEGDFSVDEPCIYNDGILKCTYDGNRVFPISLESIAVGQYQAVFMDADLDSGSSYDEATAPYTDTDISSQLASGQSEEAEVEHNTPDAGYVYMYLTYGPGSSGLSIARMMEIEETFLGAANSELTVLETVTADGEHFNGIEAKYYEWIGEVENQMYGFVAAMANTKGFVIISLIGNCKDIILDYSLDIAKTMEIVGSEIDDVLVDASFKRTDSYFDYYYAQREAEAAANATENPASNSLANQEGLADWSTNIFESEYYVNFKNARATVRVGETVFLPVVVNGNDINLNWICNDDAIASVDQNGNVTGIAPGECNIIVSTDYGAQSTCILTVERGAIDIEDSTSAAQE